MRDIDRKVNNVSNEEVKYIKEAIKNNAKKEIITIHSEMSNGKKINVYTCAECKPRITVKNDNDIIVHMIKYHSQKCADCEIIFYCREQFKEHNKLTEHNKTVKKYNKYRDV